MSEFQSHFSNIYSCIVRKNGVVLARLLALPWGTDAKSTMTPQTRIALERMQSMDVASYCGAQIKDVLLATLVANSLLAVNHIRNKQFDAGSYHHICVVLIIVRFPKPYHLSSLSLSLMSLSLTHTQRTRINC
jgi:hypothetical protein